MRGTRRSGAACGRPKALNALNLTMSETLHKLYKASAPPTGCAVPAHFLVLHRVLKLAQAVQDWEANANVHCIILKGAGEKAFCAGGDVKGMVQHIMRGEHDAAARRAAPLRLRGPSYASATRQGARRALAVHPPGNC